MRLIISVHMYQKNEQISLKRLKRDETAVKL